MNIANSNRVVMPMGFRPDHVCVNCHSNGLGFTHQPQTWLLRAKNPPGCTQAPIPRIIRNNQSGTIIPKTGPNIPMQNAINAAWCALPQALRDQVKGGLFPVPGMPRYHYTVHMEVDRLWNPYRPTAGSGGTFGRKGAPLLTPEQENTYKAIVSITVTFADAQNANVAGFVRGIKTPFNAAALLKSNMNRSGFWMDMSGHSLWGQIHKIVKSATKVALKVPLYVATAPLQLTKPTQKVAHEINTAVTNNPLTTAGALIAATGLTLATAPTAAATGTTTGTAATEAGTTATTTGTTTAVAPTATTSILPASSTAIAPTVASTPSILSTAAKTGSGLIQEGKQLYSALNPIYQAFQQQPSPEISPTAPPSTKPPFDIKSLAIPVGIGLAALFAMQ